MNIHYVLNGSDENPCTRTTILQQIGRVALLLRILRRESQFEALDAKVMRIPIWKSKFRKLKKQDVQALRSTKMKPAWHREKPQNANRKKEVKPRTHREKLLSKFHPNVLSFFVDPPDTERSLTKWILQEALFSDLPASEAREQQRFLGRTPFSEK